MDISEISMSSYPAKAYLPTKVYRDRPRGNNEPHTPSKVFEGDISDTAAVMAWIRGCNHRLQNTDSETRMPASARHFFIPVCAELRIRQFRSAGLSADERRIAVLNTAFKPFSRCETHLIQLQQNLGTSFLFHQSPVPVFLRTDHCVQHVQTGGREACFQLRVQQIHIGGQKCGRAYADGL
jgi:hypothetical protein